MMQTLLRELRYSAQMLLRQLGFTLSAIIILAVSIGTNTDAFSLANDTFRSPLPVALTEQQVKMGGRQKATDFVKVDNHDSVQPVSKSPPALTTEDVTVFFDALLPLLIRRDEIAGAVVAVVKDGRVLFAKGYGYADVAARRPVSADATLFRVASISKLFTWTAVMQLVEQGKLDLDRDVNLYLDFQIPATYPQAITLRHLMTHTPGFQMASPDHSRWPGTDLLPLKEYLLKYLPPRIFPPGSTPAYSNYGAALAGYIVQRVSGQPFEEYVAEHIFRPLGMAHSTFVQPLPNALKPMMSQGYGLASESAGQFFLVPGSPAGSLYTTATDMARFMLAHLKDGSQLYLVPSLHLGFFISQNSSGRSGRCTM